jgi:hypothetical protein
MFTMIFFAAVIWIAWKMIVLGLKLAWGLARLVCSVLLLPALLIGLVYVGLMYVAVPILVVAVILLLIGIHSTD